MKTREIIEHHDEAQVATALKAMKPKELERHASKILKRLGQDDFDRVMRAAIQKVPGLSGASGDKLAILSDVVAEHLPDETIAARPEALKRLAVVLMVLIAKKFEKIMQSQPD